MKNIAEVLEGVKTVGIGGHIRPDGDCVGSCMALYLYIRTYFPDIDVTVYLDHPKPIFGHIECIDEIKQRQMTAYLTSLLPVMSVPETVWHLQVLFLKKQRRLSASTIM